MVSFHHTSTSRVSGCQWLTPAVRAGPVCWSRRAGVHVCLATWARAFADSASGCLYSLQLAAAASRSGPCWAGQACWRSDSPRGPAVVNLHRPQDQVTIAPVLCTSCSAWLTRDILERAPHCVVSACRVVESRLSCCWQVWQSLSWCATTSLCGSPECMPLHIPVLTACARD